jgi:S1-C subfamily serine protease
MYDHPALPGDVGGPLVNAADARVVGIIGGPFDPGEVTGTATTTPAHHAFAISVEYGAALLEAEGVTVV